MPTRRGASRLPASPLANKRAKHSGSSSKAPMDEASPCRRNSLGSAAPQSFIELLHDTAGSDITFEVDGERICAHRSVLVAQSPYFREMFESSNAVTGISTAGGAVLRVEASAGALRVLLRFLYTRALPESEDCGELLRPGELVRMAYRFQEQELYQHCLKVFSSGLRTDNVIERLVDAEESGPPALRSAITEWIENNTASVKVHVCDREKIRGRECWHLTLCLFRGCAYVCARCVLYMPATPAQATHARPPHQRKRMRPRKH